MSSSFARLPHCWFLNSEIGSAELSVLAVLSKYADNQGKCFPSQSTIASVLNKSRPWVNAVIQKLSDLEIVQIEYRSFEKGGNRSAVYFLPDLVCQLADTPCQPADTNYTNPNILNISSNTAISENQAGQGTEPTCQTEKPEETDISKWEPSAEDKTFVIENTDLDPDKLALLFKSAVQAKGYQYRSFSAGYRAWALNPLGSVRHIKRNAGTSTARNGQGKPSVVVPGFVPRIDNPNTPAFIASLNNSPQTMAFRAKRQKEREEMRRILNQ